MSDTQLTPIEIGLTAAVLYALVHESIGTAGEAEHVG